VVGVNTVSHNGCANISISLNLESNSILFSVIVKIYNFVVNMLKSGAERTRAWRERKRTSEVTVQNVKKTV
jgi:hypothetical protein